MGRTRYDWSLGHGKDPKILGERIRKARMDRGLTIKQAASLIGVNVNMIANWELRNVQPTSVALEQIKAVLGMDLIER